MKRLAVAALALTALLVGAAPGLSSASSTEAPKLTDKLLTITEMPIGWTVASSSGSNGIGCLHNVFMPRGTRQTGQAKVTFIGTGGLPQVEEVLATYAVPPKTAFSRIFGSLHACKHVAGTLGRAKWTGTVAQMSFPQFGNQSAAFYVTLQTKGTSLGQYALVVRQGAVLLGLSDGTVGTPRITQFEQFAKLALTRLGGHASEKAPKTTTTQPATVTSAAPGALKAVPDVSNQELDHAEATLQADDLGYKVFGGGLFGVVIASDWTVCSQKPPPGTKARAVDLVVARSCSS